MSSLVDAAGRLLRKAIAFYRTSAAPTTPSGPAILWPDRSCPHPTITSRSHRRTTHARGAA